MSCKLIIILQSQFSFFQMGCFSIFILYMPLPVGLQLPFLVLESCIANTFPYCVTANSVLILSPGFIFFSVNRCMGRNKTRDQRPESGTKIRNQICQQNIAIKHACIEPKFGPNVDYRLFFEMHISIFLHLPYSYYRQF